MRVLVIDVGGTHVKALVTIHKKPAVLNVWLDPISTCFYP